MANAITKSTIFEDGWQNIFDAISTIPDPEERGEKWIYSAFPFNRFTDETAYPLIIIQPLNFAGTSQMTMGTSKATNIDLTIEINIYALEAIQIDSISDAIFDALEDSLTTLWTNKVKNIIPLRSNYSHFERSGMKVHFKSTVYGFEFDYS